MHKIDTAGNGGHQLMVALTAAANAPTQGLATRSQLTEIANYANLSGGSPRNITVNASSANNGTGTDKVVLDDLTLTATGTVGPFRYIVIYNDTPTSPADPLIAFYDYGSDVTLAAGETFTIDFDPTNGFFQLA